MLLTIVFIPCFVLDAIARFYLAGVLEATDDSWVAVFWVSAITLGAIGVLCFFLLKGSPADVGLPLEDEKHTAKPSTADDMDETDGRIQVRTARALFCGARGVCVHPVKCSPASR
jgi:sugar phosphate permease